MNLFPLLARLGDIVTLLGKEAAVEWELALTPREMMQLADEAEKANLLSGRPPLNGTIAMMCDFAMYFGRNSKWN